MPLKRIYWLFTPHCSQARPVNVVSRLRRTVPSDPTSARPIDPPIAWRCEHEVVNAPAVP